MPKLAYFETDGPVAVSIEGIEDVFGVLAGVAVRKELGVDFFELCQTDDARRTTLQYGNNNAFLN